jgi:hypothetical protein
LSVATGREQRVQVQVYVYAGGVEEGASGYVLIELLSKAALLAGLGEAGSGGDQAGEVGVDFRGGLDAGEVCGGFEAGKDDLGDPAAGDAFLAVACGDVAGPEADVWLAVLHFGAEEDDGVAVLCAADFRGPEYFHEIAGFCALEVGEVGAEAEFVEEAGGAGAVGVPAAPDTFAIALAVVDDEGFHGIGVELEAAIALELLDGFQENEVGGAGAEAGGIGGGEDEEFAGLEMCGADEGDGGDAGCAVLAAEGHGADFAEDGGVAVLRAGG